MPGSVELPVSRTESSSKLRSGATVAGLTTGVWEWSSTRNEGVSSCGAGIFTCRWPSRSATAPTRRWSRSVRGSPSARATSTVTALASGFTPNRSSAISSAAAESYFAGRKSPAWAWVTRKSSAWPSTVRKMPSTAHRAMTFHGLRVENPVRARITLSSGGG